MKGNKLSISDPDHLKGCGVQAVEADEGGGECYKVEVAGEEEY